MGLNVIPFTVPCSLESRLSGVSHSNHVSDSKSFECGTQVDFPSRRVCVLWAIRPQWPFGLNGGVVLCGARGERQKCSPPFGHYFQDLEQQFSLGVGAAPAASCVTWGPQSRC